MRVRAVLRQSAVICAGCFSLSFTMADKHCSGSTIPECWAPICRHVPQMISGNSLARWPQFISNPNSDGKHLTTQAKKIASAETAVEAAPKTTESEMVTIRPDEMEEVARAIFIEKLNAAFVRDVPGFSRLAAEDRADYLRRVVETAMAKGLKSEQGVASYALGVWWLGMNFERTSKKLETLLKSDYPEVRKVHAMNEWIDAYLGNPNDVTAADERLRQALELTKPWGK